MGVQAELLKFDVSDAEVTEKALAYWAELHPDDYVACWSIMPVSDVTIFWSLCRTRSGAMYSRHRSRFLLCDTQVAERHDHPSRWTYHQHHLAVGHQGTSRADHYSAAKAASSEPPRRWPRRWPSAR
jgi:hypothetical protein